MKTIITAILVSLAVLVAPMAQAKGKGGHKAKSAHVHKAKSAKGVKA